MHSPRRIAPLTRALSVAGVLAICASTASIAVASSSKKHHHPKPVHKALQLGGTWTGQYSGAFSGTFTLKWTQTGSKLTGTIVLKGYPSGSYSCDGSVSGSSINFGAVGVGATYTGTVSGSSMSGHYNTPKGGGSWSAHR